MPTLCEGLCGASIHVLHSGATLAQGLRRAIHKKLAFKLLLFFIFLVPPPTLFSFEEGARVRKLSYFHYLGLHPVLHFIIGISTFPLPGGILRYWRYIVVLMELEEFVKHV